MQPGHYFREVLLFVPSRDDVRRSLWSIARAAVNCSVVMQPCNLSRAESEVAGGRHAIAVGQTPSGSPSEAREFSFCAWV